MDLSEQQRTDQPPPASAPAPLLKPARFRWPPGPQPNPEHAQSFDATPGSPRMQARSADSHAARTAHRASVDTLGSAAPTSWWEFFEATWLGVVTPSWSQRCAQANWQPEALGLWCWRCGHSVGDFEAASTGCTACRDERIPWRCVVRLGPYQGLLREAVIDAKFNAWRALAHALGVDMGTSLAIALHQADIEPHRVALVPVPVAFRRRMLRGIDHTLNLARGVRTGLHAWWDIQARRGDRRYAHVPASSASITQPLTRSYRPTQLSRSAEQRRRNVAGSMRLKRRIDPEDLRAHTLVLIDDVLTSGATLREACRALGGARGGEHAPWVCVAGVTDDPDDL